MKTQAIKYLNSLVKDDTTKKEIDLVEFIKKCVRSFQEEEKPAAKVDWLPYFEKLWKLYPRKVNKQLAARTFEHKVRGLNEQQCLEKCRQIAQVQLLRQKEWEANGTDMQYVPHYSSFLNNQVPNSPHYKGR